MDTKKIWKDALNLIRLSVSPANFSTWFAHTYISSMKSVSEGRQLVEIACPSSFIADAVEKRYFGLVQDSLNQVTDIKNDLSFCVKQIEIEKILLDEPLFAAPGDIDNLNRIGEALKRSGINPGFTFENFAVSGSNQMGWAAADAVSKRPGEAYNPLFIWGGVGVGKTHLMLAVANRLLRDSPKERVLYCTGEDFTTEIVEAIRTKTTQEFKKKYRGVKLLMVDDIQFIAGKNTVQEEFFHTFNTILRAGGQIVLTSDTPPSEILKLESRLKSRLEAGLIIDIAPPDFELRTAITLIKASERGIELTMPAAQAISANIESPRRIEGFLFRITSEVGISHNGNQEMITDDLVYRLLNKTNGDVRPRRAIHPQEVVIAVSSYFSIGKRKLFSQNRSAHIALPRQILMFILRSELNLPLQEVGRVVGGRDHTTVMHAVEKISTNLSTNEKLREDILRIKQMFSG